MRSDVTESWAMLRDAVLPRGSLSREGPWAQPFRGGHLDSYFALAWRRLFSTQKAFATRALRYLFRKCWTSGLGMMQQR